MALFGAPVFDPAKRKSPFDSFQAPMQTPGYGGEMGTGMMAPQAPPVADYQPPSAARRIIGGLGDGLQQWAGGHATFQPQQERLQQAAMQLAASQRERAAGFADWIAKEQYKAAHPDPIKNDTVNDYQFILQTLGKDKADEYLRTIAAGPPMAVDAVDANGNTVRQYIPRSGLPGMSAPQRPAIGAEIPDPRKQGGPMPGASAGFR